MADFSKLGFFNLVLASQNSKNGHNRGLEIAPEMFRPLFRQEFSRLTISTRRKGLKQLMFQCFSMFFRLLFFSIRYCRLKIRKMAIVWVQKTPQKCLDHFLDRKFHA